MSGAPHPKSEQLARGPKRPARIKANLREWDILREKKLGPCRLAHWPGRCQGRPELHHIVSRARGGDDVADNVLSLCKWHHDDVTAEHEETLRRLAESLTDAEYAYCIDKLGEGALERLFGVLPDGAA